MLCSEHELGSVSARKYRILGQAFVGACLPTVWRICTQSGHWAQIMRCVPLKHIANDLVSLYTCVGGKPINMGPACAKKPVVAVAATTTPDPPPPHNESYSVREWWQSGMYICVWCGAFSAQIYIYICPTPTHGVRDQKRKRVFQRCP